MGAEFDALLGGTSFKTALDGSRLLFPLGTLGRGYVIASERDYQRLRRQVKIYYAVFLSIIGVPFFLGVAAPFTGGLPDLLYRHWQHLNVVPVIAVLFMGFYGVWAWSLCRRLQTSNETLSGRRVFTQAHASAVLLLLMTLVFVFGAVLWASSVLPS